MGPSYQRIVSLHCIYRLLLRDIYILNWRLDTSILTAKASLYLVGEWPQLNGNSFFERQCLLANHPVFECLDAAVEHHKENHGGDME